MSSGWVLEVNISISVLYDTWEASDRFFGQNAKVLNKSKDCTEKTAVYSTANSWRHSVRCSHFLSFGFGKMQSHNKSLWYNNDNRFRLQPQDDMICTLQSRFQQTAPTLTLKCEYRMLCCISFLLFLFYSFSLHCEQINRGSQF